MIEVGRLCVKIAGREAGKKAIIVDIMDDTFVLIDGNVKRRKCNISHIELLPEKFEIKKGASTEEVKKLFEEKGILEKHEPKVKNKKPRKGGERPKKVRPRKKTIAKPTKKSKKSEDEIVEEALKAAEEQTKSN
ncbi:MAG: 50S ribosomal protein L14e [Nanoarchaeota archaeon]|nr:50S ribosomal protein L14e [Nanoarchaeota archaeon]